MKYSAAILYLVRTTIDSSGNVVVKYIYDGWGNHAIVTENGEDIESGIGVLNPFRYHGYYYDTETGLYYLQTRYYDPVVCRFISRDSIEYADPESIDGLNLYAYCGNNSVMNVDPNGTLFWFFLGAILIGAVIGGTMNGISAYNEGQRGWGLFGAIAGGAVMGGAMGGILALGGVAGLASTGLLEFMKNHLVF